MLGEGATKFLARLRGAEDTWELYQECDPLPEGPLLLRTVDAGDCPLEAVYGSDTPQHVLRYGELSRAQIRAVCNAADGQTKGWWYRQLLEACRIGD